jgi:putative peptide zinc metalloprotease protein
MAADNLFHESWYRIAGQRVSLRGSVKAQRQFYGGEKWYVLRDPYNNQFYRLSPQAYGFISRLRASRTVEEIWQESMDRDPDGAPGQGEVIELLSQLYHANLLHYHLPPNSLKLFERHREKKRRRFQANLMNIMFFRIPLFDPDRLLQKMGPLLDRLIGKLGAVLWLGVVAAGLKTAADHWGALKDHSQGILAPSNLLLLYLGLVFVKTLHEFGHAAAVRRFGGEVHVMGVMFLIFSPLPYVDASGAWAFRSKWERAFVGAAGMIVEVFIAALAMFVWAATGPGILHSLAYNIMFVASVSTLIFNINPLLRYDGYYILADLVNMPNLHQQADAHLQYLLERHAFGLQDAETPAATPREAWGLGVYGVASAFYRVLVFGGMLLVVADRFLLLGMVMAVACFIGWVVTPTVRFVKYVAASPRLHRVRGRAVRVCAGAAAAAVVLLGLLPFPRHFKSPGMLKAEEYVVAVNNVPGAVAEVVAPSGKTVERGEPLVRLRNPELEAQLRESEAGLEESRVMFQKALRERQADMAPIAKRMDYYEGRLERLTREKSQLVVTAEVPGVWVAPDVQNFRGMWLRRGTPLGQLVNQEKFAFVSVVSQEDASSLFPAGSGRRSARRAEVKLSGQAEETVPVRSFAAVPMEQTRLPSAALGWAAGGEVAVESGDDRGTRTAEPFYQVRAVVGPRGDAALLHGRAGKIRFNLPPRPLAWQGWMKVRQLVQKRYLV